MSARIKLYIAFCSVFCTIIIAGNLLFQKFVYIPFFGYKFELSVGVLLYPVTFLISDLVTEFFGKNSASYMIKLAAVCSLMVFGLVFIGDSCMATNWSILDDKTFHKVFNVYGLATIASIIANFCGQITDVYLFSYIKRLTDSKCLWLRNNVSTIIGQGVDTVIVVTILCFFDIIPWQQIMIVIASSFSFKVIAAILDTPFCYLGHYLINRFVNCAGKIQDKPEHK